MYVYFDPVYFCLTKCIIMAYELYYFFSSWVSVTSRIAARVHAISSSGSLSMESGSLFTADRLAVTRPCWL